MKCVPGDKHMVCDSDFTLYVRVLLIGWAVAMGCHGFYV